MQQHDVALFLLSFPLTLSSPTLPSLSIALALTSPRIVLPLDCLPFLLLLFSPFCEPAFCSLHRTIQATCGRHKHIIGQVYMSSVSSTSFDSCCCAVWAANSASQKLKKREQWPPTLTPRLLHTDTQRSVQTRDLSVSDTLACGDGGSRVVSSLPPARTDRGRVNRNTHTSRKGE